MKKIFYRPEIDGLRAISILFVLLYHLDISLGGGGKIFAGGYIGVDIFFVISGYLITYLILIDLNNNNFSYLSFFQRRLRRIFPVLLIVIFFTGIAAWYILLPENLANFSKSTLYTILFNSNFYFWFYVHLQYSHEQTYLHPLLHTWSLAIEEQYYLIFPFIIIFLIRFLKQYAIYVLIISCLISLSIAQFFVSKYPSFVFYIIPFRIWEILAGSICSYFLFYHKTFFKKKNIFALIGLILIIISFFIFNENTTHPSIITIIPIIGVILIILFYDGRKKTFLKRILTNSLMIRLGLISYSLYLVHFPIFSLSRRILNFDDLLIKLLLLALSLIISIFCYKFIEKPFRKRTVNFNKVLLLCFVLTIVIIAKNFIIISNEGNIERVSLSQFQKDIIIKKEVTVKNNYNFKKSDIVVIGNSHAVDFEQILINSKILKSKNISKLNLQLSCLSKSLNEKFLACDRTFDVKKENFLIQLKLFENAKTIILKTRWGEKDIEELEKNLINLKGLNKKILVVGPNPEFIWKSSKKIKINNLSLLQNQLYYDIQPFDKFILKNNKMPKKDELEKMKEEYFNILNLEELNRINKRISEISSKNGVEFLNFSKLICDFNNNKCDFLDSNFQKIHKSDKGHFTQAGIEYLSKLLFNDILLEDFL
jgi:peptidoglycan/LPS O-acetylase OafA/YrhL